MKIRCYTLSLFLFSLFHLQAQSAEDFYHQASQFFDGGDFEKATEYYSEVIRRNDTFVNAYFNRGLAYLQLEKYHKAFFDFSKVLLLSGTDFEALENRARTRYLLGDYLGAVEDYTLAIDHQPGWLLLSNRGLALSRLKRHEEALRDFQQALRLNPDDAESYSHTADVYYALGRYEAAIEHYSKAISLSPKDALAFNNRANAYKKLGQPDRALADFARALAINPNGETLANRGLLKVEHGLDREAYADCLKALQIDASNARAYSCVGLVKLRAGDYEQALEFLDQSLQLEQLQADTYNARGMARHLGGYYHDALLDFTRAIGLDAQYSDAYSNRGATKYMMGDFLGAISDQNEAIKLDPENAIAYTRLETCYTALNKLNEAQNPTRDQSRQDQWPKGFEFVPKNIQRLEWDKP